MAGEHVAVWIPDTTGTGGKWVSIRGEAGPPGRALAIKGVKPTVADLPTPGVEGDLWIVGADGYAWDASATPPAYVSVGRVQGPPGPQGPAGVRGVDGAKGDPGASATVSVGTVSTGAAGSAAHVTNTGTANAAILNFTIPAGTKGDTGATGPAPTLSVVSTTDTANGNPATVSIAATGAGAYGLSFVIPQGARGPAGASITFHGVASSWPPPTPASGDVWQIGSPAPAGAPAPAGHMVAYDGTTWHDGGMIKGDKGDAGPTTISVDAGNVARLGADGLLFVPAGATPIATKTTLGGIIAGSGLTIDATGKLDALATAVPVATTTATGTVTLADANAITTKDGTKVVTAAQLMGQVEVKAPTASPTFTGTVSLAGGTAAAPSLVFTGDADSGIYHPAQDTVAVAIAGAPVVEFGTQMVTFPKGVTIGGMQYPQVAGANGQVLTVGPIANRLSWQHALTDANGVVFAKPGDDLRAKYAAAISAAPGTTWSATNRAALVIMPGTYAVLGDFVIDTDFCDVIGVGSAPHAPAVHITGGTVHVQAEDVCVTGISVGTNPFKVDGHPTPTPTQKITNCVGGNESFGGGGGSSTASGTFAGCKGNDYAFGGGGGVASGTFTNCTAADWSFGGGGGTASGTFTGCVGRDAAFGGHGTASGRFYDCRVTAGTFPTVTAPGMTRNCLNGDGTYDNQGGYYGTDVSTPPTAGQAWVWDATSSKWKPGNVAASLSKLTDVDTTTAPTASQALVWDGTASKWKPGTIASGFTCADGTTKKSLDDVKELLQLFAGCAANQPLNPDGTKSVGFPAIAAKVAEYSNTLPDGTLVQFDPAEFVMAIDTALIGRTTFKLPIGTTGPFNYTVDWGDGTKNTYTNGGDKPHTYAKHGRYVIKISGSLGSYGSISATDNAAIESVLSLGKLGITTFQFAFLGASNLIQMAGTLPDTVTNTNAMLQNCTQFNAPLPWDMSRVTDITSVLFGCTKFNQPVRWNLASCQSASRVFYNCSAFNKPVYFDTHAVKNMNGMFSGATSFNQDVSSLLYTALNVATGLDYFLAYATSFNTAHYDKLLEAWAAQLSAPGSTMRRDLAPTTTAKYTKAPSAAATAHAALTAAGWHITDGGPTP